MRVARISSPRGANLFDPEISTAVVAGRNGFLKVPTPSIDPRASSGWAAAASSSVVSSNSMCASVARRRDRFRLDESATRSPVRQVDELTGGASGQLSAGSSNPVRVAVAAASYRLSAPNLSIAVRDARMRSSR